MAKDQSKQTPTVTPPAVVSDAAAVTFTVVELNGNIVVQGAEGNILAPTTYTPEMQAAVDAAVAAKAAAEAPKEEVKEEPAKEAPAPVVEKTPEVVVPPVTATPAPTAPTSEFELPLGVSASSRLVITELKDYIEKMSTKARLSAAEGGQVQTMLHHILIQAINTKAEEFETVFGMVMKLIRANLKGAFSDASVHRYTPHVALPPVQAATLRYLVNALVALADPSPAVRQIAKRQINIEQALGSRQIKEDARQRVLAFFNYQ